MEPRTNITGPLPPFETLGQRWSWALALGIALIVLGLLALGSATMFTLGSVVALGIILMIGGVAQAIHGFRTRRWQGVLLSILAAILYFIVGLMMFVHPAMGAMALTLLIASFLLVVGLFRIASALTLRFEHWGWLLASGVLTTILGIIVWSTWPVSSLWVIGTFLGIELLVNGAAWVSMAIMARRLGPPRTPAAVRP